MFMNKRHKILPFAEAFFAVAAWGVSFIATKVALQDVSPITTVWLRFAMGIIIIGTTALLRKELSRPLPREMSHFALLGFIGITLHQWLQSNGLVTAGAGTSAWIMASTPVCIAIFAWGFLREKLPWRRSCGILLAALGVFIVVNKGNFSSFPASGFAERGNILMLLSAPNWAVFSVLSRRILRAQPAARMTFYVLATGWLMSTLLLFAGPGFSEISHLTKTGWIAIAFLGIFATGLAYLAWNDALQHLPAAHVGAFLYLEPPVAMAVAAAVLAERMTLTAILGGVLIIWGVYQVNRPATAASRTREA
jgi:drug/metabolite transporter (DMT)-like permease